MDPHSLSHSFYTKIKENLSQPHCPIPQSAINAMLPETVKLNRYPNKRSEKFKRLPRTRSVKIYNIETGLPRIPANF